MWAALSVMIGIVIASILIIFLQKLLKDNEENQKYIPYFCIPAGLLFIIFPALEFMYFGTLLNQVSDGLGPSREQFGSIIAIIIMPILGLLGIWLIIGGLFIPKAIYSWLTTEHDTTLW